jgi:hypothetical protein
MSLLLMLAYAGYWTAVISLNKAFGVAVPVSYWVDTALYAVFWVGVGLFGVGVAMVVAGVILDAMEMKVRYASLKKALK